MHFRYGGPRGDRFSLRLKSRGKVVGMFRHLCDVPSRSLAAAGTEEFAHPSPNGDDGDAGRRGSSTGLGLVSGRPRSTAVACFPAVPIRGGVIPHAEVGTSADPS